MSEKEPLLDEHLAEQLPSTRPPIWRVGLKLGSVSFLIGFVCVQFRNDFQAVHYETIIGVVLVFIINIFLFRRLVGALQKKSVLNILVYSFFLWMGFAVGWLIDYKIPLVTLMLGLVLVLSKLLQKQTPPAK